MRRKILIPIIIFAIPVALYLLYKFPPEKYRFWPPCIFYRTTGLYCPGCGDTRALSALLRGDIAASLAKNILFIPMLICLLLLTIRPKLALNRYFSWSVAVTVILFFILRNLPWYPVSLLAPH